MSRSECGCRRAPCRRRRGGAGGRARRSTSSAASALRDPAHLKLLTEADEADADSERRRTSRRDCGGGLPRRAQRRRRGDEEACGVRRVRGLAGQRLQPRGRADRAARRPHQVAHRRAAAAPLPAPADGGADGDAHPPGEEGAGLGRRHRRVHVHKGARRPRRARLRPPRGARARQCPPARRTAPPAAPPPRSRRRPIARLRR